MRRHVSPARTDASKERVVSMFRTEKIRRQPANRRNHSSKNNQLLTNRRVFKDKFSQSEQVDEGVAGGGYYQNALSYKEVFAAYVTRALQLRV
jgi:hypothetical protein